MKNGSLADKLQKSIFAVGAGALAALGLALFFSIVPPSEAAKQSLLNLGTLEELVKFTAVILFAAAFGAPLLSPIAVGAGFGITEAMLRLFEKGVLSPIPIAVHIIAGFSMAFFFTKGVRQPTRFGTLACHSLALVVPILFHLTYNISVVPYLAGMLG